MAGRLGWAGLGWLVRRFVGADRGAARGGVRNRTKRHGDWRLGNKMKEEQREVKHTGPRTKTR